MNFLSRITVILLILLLTACSGQEDAPSTAPANVSVEVGSGLVVVDWDKVPGRTYWLFYKEGTSVSLSNFDRISQGISPPYIATGLTNGTQYAFAVTSSKDGSKVGPFSSPVNLATPRMISPSIAWTIGTPLGGGANDLRSIALGSNTFVTVGDAATVYAAEYDYLSVGGVESWVTATTLPGGLAANLNSVVYDGTRFVALGDDGSIIRSTDAQALTWESATAITTPPVMNALAYGAGIYVAVGNGGAIYSNTSGGVTDAWTDQTLGSGTTDNLYSVSYINGRFIAVGASGTISTSTDGATWSTQTQVDFVTSSLRAVAYGASTYVAVGDTGAIVSSPDAITWTEQSIPTIGGIPITESFRAISFGPDAQFVTVGTSGVNAYTSTGADGSWQSSTTNAGSIGLNAIAASLPPTPLYIAIGAAGANVSSK